MQLSRKEEQEQLTAWLEEIKEHRAALEKNRATLVRYHNQTNAACRGLTQMAEMALRLCTSAEEAAEIRALFRATLAKVDEAIAEPESAASLH